MKKIAILLSIMMLSSCGGSGGSSAPNERPNGQVAGVAHDNILVGADINIYSLGGELLGTGTTDKFGEYDIQLSSVPSQIVLVEATNGRYTEEFSSKTIELQEGDFLRAYVYYEQAGNIDISVTLLSTIAAGYAEYLMDLGVSSFDAISQSNTSISKMAGVDIENTTPLDITDVVNARPSLDDQLKYSFITASVSPLMSWVSDENNLDTHDPFNSINFAKKAYDDIRHDGALDGEGVDGVLAFGVTPITTDMYRDLAVNMLIMANNDNNVTSIDAEDLLDFANQFNASNHPAFGAEQSPPAPLSAISPNVTNFSWSEAETISASVSLSVDVVDRIGVDSVVLKIDGKEYVATNPDAPEFIVDTTNFTDGVYTAEIIATSATTGITKVGRTITIANAGLAISDVHPVDGEYIRGNYPFSAVVTDPISVTSVQFQIDNNIFYEQSTLDNPVQVLDTTQVIVTEGVHTFTVTAENQAGFDKSVTNTFYLDNTNPQISTALNNGRYITEDYTLQSTISDNLGIDNVVLYLDEEVISDISDDLSSAYSLSHSMIISEMEEGEHSLAVEVSDKAGNNSQLTRSFFIDKFSPDLVITTVDGQGAQGTYLVAWESSDNVGLVDHKVYVGGAYKQSVSADTKSISLAAGDSQGLRTVTVEATDVAGRVSSDSITYYLDYTKPTIDSWGLIDGTMLPEIYSDSITVSDNVQISAVSLSLDGVKIHEDLNVGANFTREYSLTRSQLTEGSHTLSMEVTDMAGNVSSSSRTFIVDNYYPSVNITTGTSTVTNTFTLSWSASDSVGITSQKVYVDNTLYATLSGSTRSLSMSPQGSEGSRNIRIDVYDASGKMTSDAVSKNYQHIAPTVTYTAFDWGSSCIGQGCSRSVYFFSVRVSSNETISETSSNFPAYTHAVESDGSILLGYRATSFSVGGASITVADVNGVTRTVPFSGLQWGDTSTHTFSN